MAISKNDPSPSAHSNRKYPNVDEETLCYTSPDDVICLDEVQYAIDMPKFDPEIMKIMNDQDYIDSIELKEEVIADLRKYVTLIANSYNDNPL